MLDIQNMGNVCYVFLVLIVTYHGGLHYYLSETQTTLRSRCVLNLSDYKTNITCDIFGNRLSMVTKNYNVIMGFYEHNINIIWDSYLKSFTIKIIIVVSNIMKSEVDLQ